MKPEPASRKKPEQMTHEELRAACGVPEGCPQDVMLAVLRGEIDRASGGGVEAVRAAVREQENWSPERNEEARLRSPQRQRRVT
ncbi:MAG TPA: hypothetical protein VGK20_04040 [Candidatus Binatia bacterium]|jgi:hypothetical protein